MRLERYQRQVEKGRKTHTDIAATAQNSQDALELKGEKTSFLPVPGTY